MILVYVSGPIGANDEGRADRIASAMGAGSRLLVAGVGVVIPHAWAAAGISDDLVTYERWMELDFEQVKRCDALLRLPGHSPGAEREVAYAKELGHPVFHDEASVVAWARAVEVPAGERCPDDVVIVNRTARGGAA